MPTYEYRCTECGERTEAFQRMSDAPLTTCPSCHKEGLKRLVSGGAGVLYKGEGWYVTDYSKKSSGGKETPSQTSSSSTASSSSNSATPGKDPGAAPGTTGASGESNTSPATKPDPKS